MKHHAISPIARMAKVLLILLLIAAAAFVALLGFPLWAVILVFIAGSLVVGGI